MNRHRHRPPTFSREQADIITGRMLHELAADLDVLFDRRRRHPIALHLAYAALSRAAGSSNSLDAELATSGNWQRLLTQYNEAAATWGSPTVGIHLPQLTADTYRHTRTTLTDHLEFVRNAFTRVALDIAHDVGLLPTSGGSLTRPSPARTIYGDGCIVRPLYRPDSPGRTDPDTAQHHRHDGPHWGNNLVTAYTRGPGTHLRVILGAGRVDAPGREADTAVALFGDILDAAEDRIQAVVYDGALRGVHHNQLMRRHGVVVVTKVHAAARREGIKIARTIPLATRTHHTPAGPCTHTLVIHDGAIHDATIDAAGTTVLTDPLDRHQVRRTHSARNGYRFALGVTIPCGGGDFTAWNAVHGHADQLRLIPEHDPHFPTLYGLRNDAESNNNSYKRTLPGRRAAALGWRRQLLDVLAWGILVNSRAWSRHAGVVARQDAA